MSDSKTKILIVEHDKSDIELIQRELKKAGHNYVAEVVETESDFEHALFHFDPDIILSDYSLPSFTGPEAFKIKQKKSPNTPFVFVSGTIGEENSIELLKNGVTDYALKDKLFTLSVKIERALKESKEKQLKIKREQDLVHSERRLARAQQIAHMGSWELDFATGIANWSDEACRIYGLSPLDNRQTFDNWLSYTHPDDMDFVLKEVMKSQSSLLDTSFHRRIIRKDGNIRDIYSESKFEFDASGNPTILFGIEHDVTEMKTAERDIKALNQNLEEKIKQRTAELENANTELEAFSYTVSHDLQAPLRIVNGFTKIMLDDYGDKVDENGREHLLLINKMVKRMSQLIKDLLAFSHLGKTLLVRREVDMNDIVKVVLEEVKISDPNLSLQVKLHDLAPTTCDSGLIKQVWSNLIQNAFKYSKKSERPVIEIGMTNADDAKAYYVKDNGAGFDMKYADQLFAVFRRLHSDKEFEGTGVGLALVHRILQRHGGKIWAEAKVNEGATFYFTIP